MKLSSKNKLILWLVAGFAAPGIILFFAALNESIEIEAKWYDRNFFGFYFENPLYFMFLQRAYCYDLRREQGKNFLYRFEQRGFER